MIIQKKSTKVVTVEVSMPYKMSFDAAVQWIESLRTLYGSRATLHTHPAAHTSVTYLIDVETGAPYEYSKQYQEIIKELGL